MIDPQVISLEKTLENIFRRQAVSLGTKRRVGVIVSGGIDSSLVAYYTSQFFKNTFLFTFHSAIGKDLLYAKLLSQKLKKPLAIVNLNKEKALNSLPQIKKVLQKKKIEPNVTNLCLALGFFLLFENISLNKIDAVFTGQGPDVLLAGYHKYKSLPLGKINSQIKKDLPRLKVDKIRDQAMADIFKIKLINPYLEKSFVELCLAIPARLKISQSGEKLILRQLGKKLGLPEKIVSRPKKAFQYSSKIQKIIYGC